VVLLLIAVDKFPYMLYLYVEDLKRGTNEDIGPKDIFEMAARCFQR
jgi:hypothetical protein